MQAVSTYQQALLGRMREDVRSIGATTQNNLANALGTLGARESGTELLLQAVGATANPCSSGRASVFHSNWP